MRFDFVALIGVAHRRLGMFGNWVGNNNDASERLGAMLEVIPMAVMTCDLQDFTINYVNPATIEGLKAIEHLLPCKAENIVGQSIDIFHKVPSHQRQLLSDPSNLPHRAQIKLGDEVLDLHVNALFENGRYVGPMLTWSVITERVKAEEETEKLLQMLDNMPVNVMMADKETLELNYVNKTSVETLRPLEHLLPVKVDNLQGTCIDIFHKHPEHQRAILADPNRLPFRSKIKLGEETLDLEITPIFDKNGEYLAPMLNWMVVTNEVKLADDLEKVSGKLANAADGMNERATTLAAASQETTSQSSAVVAAIEQLSTSISEISTQVTNSASVSRQASDEASKAGEVLGGMDAAAQQITNVVNLIQEIADQTNLLALNATIEAARAGESGKGFAVVAAEVKDLASQTGRATSEISAQIEAIQSAAKASVEGVSRTIYTISQVAEMATTVSAAIEEQKAATNEAAHNISSVSDAAGQSSKISDDFQTAANELASDADALKQTVQKFLLVG